MDNYDELIGKEVYSQEDEKIGTIDSLYVGDTTDELVFATVKTGWIAGSSFVPLQEAQTTDDRVVVPYTKEQVKGAPNIDEDSRLSSDEENRLYEYYGLTDDADTATDDEYDEEDEDERTFTPEGEDTSGPNTDDAMTRSEEEVNVGTRTEESGRYRLKKYVVTENVTQTVPVEREEVRLERTPITDENRDAAMSGPELSDEEHEVVTHAEVPTVDKKVVPKERFKVGTETVRDEETVNEDVRKEQVDLEKDGDNR